jgi:rfaE bifunctional protein kinase chain/domain
VLAGDTHSAKQQVVRIDRIEQAGRGAASHVRKALGEFRGRVDGILVSDYGLGCVTLGVVRAALALARSRDVPITIDSRHQLLSFRGMTAVTPNEPEVEEALGIRIGHDERKLERAGRALLRKLRSQAVLITRGADGMALFEKRRRTVHLPIHGSDQVTDVTGAGDTVIATFTLALAAGATPVEASQLANCAGGIVVMKSGTATVSEGELRAAARALDES